MKCKYCGSKRETKKSLAQHQIRCVKNPDSQKLRENWKKTRTKIKQVPWNLGLTKNDSEKMLHISEIMKMKSTGKAKDELSEKERIEKIKKTISINRKTGGIRKGSGRGIKTWYESPIAGLVYLRSTYELEYAKYLDSLEIKWKQNEDYFEYYFEGKKLKYYPDFYIIDEDLYVEIKGFKTKKDTEKWKAVENLKILFKKDLIELGIKIK